jgi:hypothetical protein
MAMLQTLLTNPAAADLRAIGSASAASTGSGGQSSATNPASRGGRSLDGPVMPRRTRNRKGFDDEPWSGRLKPIPKADV